MMFLGSTQLKHQSEFDRLDGFKERGSFGVELGLVFELGGFRFGFAQLDHDFEVLEFFLGLEKRVDAFAEGTLFVEGLAGLLVVVPEVAGGGQRLQFTQAFVDVGDVKETSASARVCRRRRRSEL